MRTIRTILAGLVILMTGLGVACENPANQAPPVEHPTITYKANGGATADGVAEIIDATTYNNGDAATLKACSFFLDGNNFTSWNTAADGSGTAYAEGAAVTLTDNLVLFATWTAKSKLELLKGLKGVVRTQYELDGSGSKRSLKEWSTSYDGTGAEVNDYYAVYTYSVDGSFGKADYVYIYASEASSKPAVTYEYRLDAGGNITEARYYVGEPSQNAVLYRWEATYNTQGKYLTYKFYEDEALSGTMSTYENRACEYAADGVNYTKETYYYGDSTLEADVSERFEPTYEGNDPTTGRIAKEKRTQIVRDDGSSIIGEDNSGEYSETIVTTYNFSWATSGYLAHMNHEDGEGVVTETWDYTCEKIKDAWLKTGSLYTAMLSPTTYNTYAFDAGTGDMTESAEYDLTNGKQLSSRVRYQYETDDAGKTYTTARSYAYSVTRGIGSAASIAFKTVPTTSGH